MNVGKRGRIADTVRAWTVGALAGPELDARIRAVAKASRLADHVIFGDPARVTIGAETDLNDALLNVSSGRITVEPTAFFGHSVLLLTGTHDVHRHGRERQAAVPSEGYDIVVERGAWLASGVIVLGPCRIGAHAVVAAGSVVTHDVAPGVMVAGVPARPTGRVVGPAPSPRP